MVPKISTTSNDGSVGHSRSTDYPSSPRTPTLSSTLSPRLKASRASGSGRSPDISPHRLPPRLDADQAGGLASSSLPPPQIYANGHVILNDDQDLLNRFDLGPDDRYNRGYIHHNSTELDEKYRDLVHNQLRPGPGYDGRAVSYGPTTPPGRSSRPSGNRSSPGHSTLGLTMPDSPGRRRSYAGAWQQPSRSSISMEDPAVYARIVDRRSGVSPSGLRSFLVNPLAVPTSHPYLRVLATIVVYGLTLTVVSSWLGNTSAVVDSSLLQRIKGQSSLSDLEITRLAEELRLSSSFPLPPNRPVDRYGSPNAAYRALYPLAPPPAPFPALRATHFLPDRCLEGWFAHGEILCSRHEIGEEDQL
jgi:hypothetical protein